MRSNARLTPPEYGFPKPVAKYSTSFSTVVQVGPAGWPQADHHWIVDITAYAGFTGNMGRGFVAWMRSHLGDSVARGIGVGVCACILMIAPAAAAAAADFTVQSLECGGARGGGQADRAGMLYVACATEGGVNRPHIQIYDAQGVRSGTVNLPTYATDVAPAPDGQAIYVFDRTSQSVRRWTKQLDGSWTIDPAWKLAQFTRWGSTWNATGEFLATDDDGFIYVSTGTWTTAPNAIVKFAADGSFVTDVGDFNDGWALGDIYWMNSGIAVTPDGSHVYLTEVGNNRVERFDRAADGTYSPTIVPVGNSLTDEDPRTGWCGTDVRPGRLAAPYDIGIDAAEHLYVANTSCGEVKVFDVDGVHLATIPVTSPTGHIHAIAVDRAGRVMVAEANSILTPAGVQPLRAAPPKVQLRWATQQDRGWAYAWPRAGGTGVNAWLWTTAGWQQSRIPQGTSIWIQTMSTGFMWAWTSGSWYAVRTSDIAVRA